MKTTINLRISKELKEELQFIALEKDIKISELFRDIIKEYIENYYYQEELDLPKTITLPLPTPTEEQKAQKELQNYYNNLL